MPRYLLDTNICIYLMKHQPAAVRNRFAQCYAGDVIISAITYAELVYGIEASANPERELMHLSLLIEDIPVIPFGVEAAIAYGPVRRATRESKRDHLDKLIAAHALSLKVTLVTNNVKDFAKYPGLVIENWVEVQKS
ncbi:type II toxin-antitoxin system VapC family toxin [Acidithiobacillus sp. MC6.1]|nr:type II toxin-antitoxin system VapC family toxin [Acidithiobacillus sp. MC6.1]